MALVANHIRHKASMCWPNTIRNIQLSISTVAIKDLNQLGATLVQKILGNLRITKMILWKRGKFTVDSFWTDIPTHDNISYVADNFHLRS